MWDEIVVSTMPGNGNHWDQGGDQRSYPTGAQLAWVDQEPLYQIYLDLRKAYHALDRGGCLEILAGYGVGPNLIRLQKKFWDDGMSRQW